MRSPLTVFCTPAPESYVPVPRFSERMVVCGPHIDHDRHEEVPRTLKTPGGRFDLAKVLSVLPRGHEPDVVVVWADASRAVEPANLGAVPGRKVLIIGDTHHQAQPIQSLLRYALSERFDAHVIVATRQHAHFFAEAGLTNLFWIPSLVATPVVRPFREARRRAIAFVGQMGRFHPRRRRLIDALAARGYPIEAAQCTREEAAVRYGESVIALNISLNSDLNFRPYEIPAAGGFLLTDQLSEQAGLEQFYREGEHYVAYGDFDDLCRKMEHYLEHPLEAAAIARAGHAAYLSTLDRDRIRRTFWSAVIEGRTDAAFDLSHEHRVGLRPVVAPADVLRHAGLYELFQELHRRDENIDVLFLPGAGARLAVDIADLPRLRLHTLDDGRPKPALIDALPRAGVEVVSAASARARVWDVLVAPASALGTSNHGDGAEAQPSSAEASAALVDTYQFRHLVVPDLARARVASIQGTHPDLRPSAADLPIFSRDPKRRADAAGTEASRRLHIGGLVRSSGWEVLNAVPGSHVDHVGNAGDLSRFADGTFAAIYASHVLEHFDYKVTLEAALGEWWRVLEPGGQLFVSVPDLDVLCRIFLHEGLAVGDRFFVMRMIFGGHVDQHDYHLVGLNEELLAAFLEGTGFEHLKRVESFGLFEDTSLLTVDGVPISLNVTATKGVRARSNQAAQSSATATHSTSEGGSGNGTPPPQSEVPLSSFLDGAARLLRAGEIEQADACYRSALAQLTPALRDVALVAMQRGLLDGAKALLGAACELAPDRAPCWIAYGRVLMLSQRHLEASQALECATEADPDAVEAHALLGISYFAQNRNDEAAEQLGLATELAPDDVTAWKVLGALRWQQGRLTEAAGALTRSLAISPGDADSWNNLGAVLHDQGCAEEGETAFLRALEAAPHLGHVEPNQLFYATCSARKSADEIASLHRAWGERLAARLGHRRTRHDNPRQLEKRLRIGYVSADFNEHPVGFFLSPVLAAHSRDSFDVICFANGGGTDWMTAAQRVCADGWHDIGGSTDDEVDNLIRREQIDVLVDLAGHSAGSRLSVFARRPAPVQVTYLGYPSTTGLSAIQYRITDAFADPPGETERWHVEELVRPSSSFLCYEPPPRCPAVADLPFRRNGLITFGSFNHHRKLNAGTMALWSGVLHAVPGSRLVLKSQSSADETCRAQVLRWLAEQDIAIERVEIAPFQPSLNGHLACYGEVDIALDTFPYNGTTTTCEALWMGVPVITRAGHEHRSRVGASLLSNAGFGHLVAESDEAFVSIAGRLASDTLELANQRRTMRSRLLASPLLDADRFTRALEGAYRDMWRRWCAASESGGQT